MRRHLLIVGWLAGSLLACDPATPKSIDEIGVLPDTVTFAADVAPIIYEHCSVCHRSGGHGPMSLTSYQDVKAQGLQVVAAVAARRMPPWLPEPGPHPIAGARRLTARHVAIIRRWVDQEMPLGDSAALPPVPVHASGWALGTPDLVVTMPEAFPVPAGGRDQFRNFVIPVPIDAPRYVRAIDLDPGDTRAVHHAVVNIDRTRSSRRADAQDPGLGFDGMFAGSAAHPPEGFFLGWTPGKVPDQGTPGLAWRLEPGTDIVLQLHLQPHGDAGQVRASIGLYFTDEPPSVLSYWLSLGSRQIDIPAGKRGVVVEDSYRLPVDVEVFGVYPHAHFLGDEIVGDATLPTGEVVRLLHIKKWNFNQQDAYRFVDPVPLPSGTRLSMRISFDNTAENPLNPTRPPQRVVYGPASGDEMANLFVHVLVRDSTDLGRLAQDFGVKYQRDLKTGFEFLLGIAPTNVAYRTGLADALFTEGDLGAAKEQYRRALAIQPSYQQARYGLARILQNEGDAAAAGDLFMRVLQAEPDHVAALYGMAEIFQSEGDLQNAVSYYGRVIDLEPTHANALNNLGNAMVEARRPLDAIPFYLRTLALQPNHADARNNVGNLYRDLGRLSDAVAQYRLAVQARPRHSLARFNLGRALVESGSVREGLEEMRISTQIDPEWPVSWATLAWTLATHEDDSVRNPVQAIEYGRRAADLTGNAHPIVLDALAAAYAAGGQFERAVDTARRGVQIAQESGETDLAGRIRSRLALYERGESYRVSPGG